MCDPQLSRAKALARETVRALWIAVSTPFTASGLVGEEVLAASVDYYIDGIGVAGIFYGGVIRELWALTVAERQRVHELVAERTAGRILLLAHTGQHVSADTVELVPKWYRNLTAATSIGDCIVEADASEGEWLDLHLNREFQALMSTPALALVQSSNNRTIAEYTARAEAGDLAGAWCREGTLCELARGQHADCADRG